MTHGHSCPPVGGERGGVGVHIGEEPRVVAVGLGHRAVTRAVHYGGGAADIRVVDGDVGAVEGGADPVTTQHLGVLHVDGARGLHLHRSVDDRVLNGQRSGLDEEVAVDVVAVDGGVLSDDVTAACRCGV